MSKKCILRSQTTTTLSPIEKYCYDISYCGLNQFCDNNRCEYQPSYEYSYTSNACLFKSCLIENNCQKYDKNTYCNGGSCICSSGYTIDPKTKICNKTVEKSCKTTLIAVLINSVLITYANVNQTMLTII